MTDREITGLICAGDSRGLQNADEKYRSQGVNLAARICGSRRDGEEIFSDALLVLWENCRKDPPQDVHAYLCRVIRNLSLKKAEQSLAKKRSFEVISPFDVTGEAVDDDPVDSIEAAELANAINEYLHSCKRDARKVFVCRCYYGMSVTDTAKHLKMSESKVKSSLMRTRKGLRTFLERNGSI